MNPDEFTSAIVMLFGPGKAEAIAGAAEFLGVAPRNVARWAGGQKPVGPQLSEALVEAMRAAIYDQTACSPSAARNAAFIRQALALEREAA